MGVEWVGGSVGTRHLEDRRLGTGLPTGLPDLCFRVYVALNQRWNFHITFDPVRIARITQFGTEGRSMVFTADFHASPYVGTVNLGLKV